jgi:hypothetical protein
MKDRDITIRIMNQEYVLSPFAARKLRESMALAARIAGVTDDISTPLHPMAKRRWFP